MPHPKIQLKNPLIAGIFAYLVPGAGHLYQGRYFKGVLYLVCILGTFLSGMALAEGKVVSLGNQQGRTTWGYFSQVLVGLPALPAWFQSKRYASLDPELKSDGVEKLQRLPERISTAFSGRIRRQNADGEIVEGSIEGEINLEPAAGSNGSEVEGTFRGTFEGGEHIEFSLSSPISVGPKVIAAEDVSLRFLGEDQDHHKIEFSGRRRYLMCQIAEQAGHAPNAGLIEGTIPRSFWDWFEVPLEDSAEQYLNGLGKRYELAMVFTWIAGLLNILAIWDAVQGPAYGYGDEEQTEEGEGNKDEESAKPDSASTQPSASQAEVNLDPDKKSLVNSQAGRSSDPSINPRQ